MNKSDSSAPYLPDTWIGPDGEPVSCHDKLAVLQDNLAELQEMAQEALEDAIVMGCDETQFKRVLADLVTTVRNPFV